MSVRYAPHPAAAWRDVAGHVFIISADNRQHELEGDVELFVWGLCAQAPRDLAELAAAVSAEFRVDTETARKDLSEFLDKLVSEGVVIASQ